MGEIEDKTDLIVSTKSDVYRKAIEADSRSTYTKTLHVLIFTL